MRLISSIIVFATLSFLYAGAQDLKQKSMDMLYKYMPAADSANYSRQFFEHNVDLALKAREEMPWGKIVPEREFLHFVMPIRINNEALDGHREVFYDELKDRVKNLSMKDAILEINHWCHEKVTYQPSDGRTHSPLASCSSAIGRCGEESTFGVAALRAMGIPARQVYTPRWAHTDDNHAWVEAWADGNWYFLGACEPEPVLNLGWFNSPASRGMLMHARIFGPYEGSEEILSTAPGITDINVTDHYAPVDTIHVTVYNADGTPANGAKVSFRLYNYAEFYPIATKSTDSNGHASVAAGLGDLLVWATDGKSYAYKKISVGKDRTTSLTLNPVANHKIISEDLDIIPPMAGAATVPVTPEMRKANDILFAQEDSIRMEYVSTFITDNTSPEGTLLTLSRGNHAIISEFLQWAPDKKKAISLLQNLSEKDLTDVQMDVLKDHYATAPVNHPYFAKYIMSPRIEREQLTPFRAYFIENIPVNQQALFRLYPEKWVSWVGQNIDASMHWYPSTVTMDPARVWEGRKTSALSRDIFFVAAARSMGIPARLNPITGDPEWADKKGDWHEAVFVKTPDKNPAETDKTPLTLTYEVNSTVEEPLYYSHFTVSKITDGEPQLLNFDDFDPLANNFGKGVELSPGQYMIVTGQRLANGGVLSHMDIVELGKEPVTLPLTLRSDTAQIQVVGSLNSELKFQPKGNTALQSILATTGRGYFVVALVKPGHEPSNHVLRDIATLKSGLEANGTPIIILTGDNEALGKLDEEIISKLPSTVTLGSDEGNQLSEPLTELAGSTELPVIVIADTFNRVVYISNGYTIGAGQKLLDTLNRLK